MHLFQIIHKKIIKMKTEMGERKRGKRGRKRERGGEGEKETKKVVSFNKCKKKKLYVWSNLDYLLCLETLYQLIWSRSVFGPDTFQMSMTYTD